MEKEEKLDELNIGFQNDSLPIDCMSFHDGGYNLHVLPVESNEKGTNIGFTWSVDGPQSSSASGETAAIMAPENTNFNYSNVPFIYHSMFQRSPKYSRSPQQSQEIKSEVKEFKSKPHYVPTLASRQSHNEKERIRRSRMKESCQMLRSLVPGVNDKTDKATVLECTVQYIKHLQNNVENHFPNNA